MIVISRPDKGMGWRLMPETKTYSQFKFSQEMVDRAMTLNTLCDWTVGGSRVIDGRRCIRYVGRYRHHSEPCKAHEVHYVDAKTKMPRRVVTYNLHGKKALTMDYLNVVMGPPPRELFEIPPGYKRAYRKKDR